MSSPSKDHEDLCESLREVIRNLRLGCEAEANQGFIALIGELHGWIQTELTQPSTSTDSVNWPDLLHRLLLAQERADVLALADGLEYELQPAIVSASLPN